MSTSFHSQCNEEIELSVIVSISIPISLLNIGEEFLKFLLSISIIDELGDEGVWECSGT